jgi:hypothetical protein
MTTIVDTFGGLVVATTFSGSGASLTNIPFSAVTTGSTNSALWVNGAGAITATGPLPNTFGGTGADTSAFTGVAKVAAGVWTASSVVNADISATAAIAFTKLATLAVSGVVTTDVSGVITATTGPLSRTLGGTGVNLSAAIPQFSILATNSAANVIDATLTYGTTATANSLVQRDGSGNVAFGSISVNTITSTGSITFTPVGGNLFFGTNQTNWSASASANAWRVVATQTTTAATAATLLAITTTTGTNGRAYALRGLVTCGNGATPFGTGSYSFLLKFKNIGSTLTSTGTLQLSSALDADLSAPAIGGISVSVATQTLNIQVTGKTGINLTWTGVFDLCSQSY